MKTQTFKTKALALGLLASIAVVFMCMFCPTRAIADEVAAHSIDEFGVRTDYYSSKSAIEAGYTGKVIVMDRNWSASPVIEIAKGKTITIDMNGYIMYGGAGTAMIMREGSNLTLTSSQKVEFEYYGYSEVDASANWGYRVTSGGLLSCVHVIDANTSSTASWMYMEESSTLTLDNVAVCGNWSEWGGGVMQIYDDCEIYMKNGATFQHNRGEAFEVLGEDVHIYMDNSSISYNFANVGTGVHGNEEGTRVYMENGSSMNYNWGGAICFEDDYCSVKSEDKTAVIKGNYRKADGCGLVFSGSHSFCYGITFQDNESTCNGGAICVNGGDNYIEDCTITNNWCGSGNEGGGVYTSPYRDINLKGKVIIKNNTRGKDGSADDLFLAGNWLFDAYIQGSVEQGSEIGIRTNSTGARLLAKNVSPYYDGIYFMDMINYYVTHGDDHGGDLWQRRKSNILIF